MGDVTREAEKEETMVGDGRGNNDNANNGCYGGEMLEGRREQKLYVMRNFGTYFTGTYVYLLVLHKSLLHKSAIFC